MGFHFASSFARTSSIPCSITSVRVTCKVSAHFFSLSAISCVILICNETFLTCSFLRGRPIFGGNSFTSLSAWIKYNLIHAESQV